MADTKEYLVVERLSGSGTITGSGDAAPIPVRYEIIIRQEANVTPEAKHLGGRVWSASAEDPFMAHRLLSRKLQLTTQDGRTWDFSFVHRNGEIADS